MTTVLIVDDHAGFRSVARRLLEENGFRVVGEASNGQEALAGAEAVRPQVILLDVRLPDMDGFQVADQLGERLPSTRIVLISTRSEEDYRDRLAHTTAAGFISKGELTTERLRRLIEER